MTFSIREYRPSDARATMRVFRAAIMTCASADYDERQIRAWAGHTGTTGQWNERRLSAVTWVAQTTDDRTVAGFIDVDATGYIDMLYVDPVYTRQGVATALLGAVMACAEANGISRLNVHASITARPFFERHGFQVTQTRHPVIGDVSFVNYRMVRLLSGRPESTVEEGVRRA